MKSQSLKYSDINTVLAEITSAIVGHFDLQDLLDRVVGLAMRLLNAEVCSVFLNDKQNPGHIRMMAGSGFAKKLVGKAEYKIGEGFTGFVAQTGLKFNIKSKKELVTLASEAEGSFIWKGKHDSQQWESGANEFRNMIALPLKIKNEIFGVIKVENKDRSFGNAFSEEDEGIFEIIANVVSMAIENARLHAEIETQLKAISAKAAHRINNQSATYDGIELDLLDEIQNPTCDKENLARICRALVTTTSNLKRLTSELKNYGRPITLNRKYLSINKIAQEEAWLAKPPEQITIELALDQTIPDILIDERFTESIRELLRNAITAIWSSEKRAGMVRITTQLQIVSGNNIVVVRIEDDGPGFPPQFPVFEPFHSTNPQSSGLGLTTVKELVEQHGGKIQTCESSLGGACLEIRIPALTER